jgi:hypothetical protein
MRLARHIPDACDRARERASREVDDELSAFELRLLLSHVERCDECGEFRANVGASTGLLRAAPLELPSTQIRIPGARRYHSFARRVIAPTAAAAMVAAAAVVMTVGSFGSGKNVDRSLNPTLSHVGASTNADLLQQRFARRVQLINDSTFTLPGFGGPQLPTTIRG